MSNSTNTPSARQLLVDWANGQDGWVRRVVAEVFVSRQELSDDALGELYALLLAEKGLSEDAAPYVPRLSLGTSVAETREALRLVKLHDVENVNALTTGQEIEFNPHLTVLFGENAAGKSGYVRILKSLAAVRSEETVLPDVRKIGNKAQKAHLTYALGDATHEAEWTGEKGVAPFTRMNVFDSRAVALHVDEDLAYVYTPRDLGLYSAINNALERIRQRLEEANASARPSTNPFLSHFTRGTPVYLKIETLGPQTDLGELRTTAAVSEEEEQGLEGLRAGVQALQSGAAGARLQIARTDGDLFTRILDAASILRGFDWLAYAAVVAAAQTATERHREATERAFAGTDIPEVLSAPWAAFVQAGEEYIRHIGVDGYPHEDDKCIYCRQPLTQATMDLVKKYQEFCNATLRQDMDAAKRAVAAAAQPLTGLSLSTLQGELVKRLSMLDGREAPPPVLARGRALVDAALPIQEQIGRGQPVNQTPLPEAEEVVPLAQAALEQARNLIANMSAEASEREKALAQQTAVLRELEARLKLREHLPGIVGHVEKLKWASKADTILAGFRSLLRSLTETSKIASEKLLNEDFERLFESERKQLCAPSVKLDFPGRSGASLRRKSLVQGHALSDILSEGEQKVIALADFLAEAALPKAGAPIIFDDPVNSLDYKRLEYVVNRIVQLAQAGQVIVFTHNIWFAVELLSYCEKNPDMCTYYDVAATEETVGLVEKGTHPRWDNVKKTSGTINQVIAAAEKASGEVRQALVESGYDWIRAWCEVVVEQELLGGVTQRYQPHVRMTCLPNIKADRLEATIGVILPIFERACRATPAHSQPLETLSVRPKLEDLKKDWGDLQQARLGYLK